MLPWPSKDETAADAAKTTAFFAVFFNVGLFGTGFVFFGPLVIFLALPVVIFRPVLVDCLLGGTFSFPFCSRIEEAAPGRRLEILGLEIDGPGIRSKGYMSGES